MAATATDEYSVRRVTQLVRAGHLSSAKQVLKALPVTAWTLNRQMQISLQLSNFHDVEPLWLRLCGLCATTLERSLGDALRACARAAIGLPKDESTRSDDSILTLGNDGAEVGYYLATEAWMRFAYRRAEDILLRCAPTEPRVRAQLLIVRSLIAAATDRLHEQAAACETALAILLREAPDESAYISAALWHLSTTAREAPIPVRIDSLEEIERTTNWTEELLPARLQVLRALGWARVLAGDCVAAMRLFNVARSVADSAVLRLFGHLDYAAAAQLAGSRAAALAEFRCALEVFDGIDWNAVNNEGAVSLLVLAGTGAQIDHINARRVLEQAVPQISRQISPAWVLAHGRCWQALTAEASALVAAAHDEFFEAQRQAAAACEDFSRMGFSWRAGRMAVLMHQLSGKSYWRDRARTLLAEYPNSVFAKQLGIEAGEVRLTRRQEQVLEFLRRGYTSEAIAAELNMARNTVHTHITAIHRAYGVQRRSELLAKLAGTV